MFVPVPPSQPTPPPEDQPARDVDVEVPPEEDEAPELEVPYFYRPPAWPAVVRWARLCRVLAFVSLVTFGFLAARNLYLAVSPEPPIGPFLVAPVTPAAYAGNAVLHTIGAIASCISLLGFAELLHVVLSIEKAAHRPGRRPARGRAYDEPSSISGMGETGERGL